MEEGVQILSKSTSFSMLWQYIDYDAQFTTAPNVSAEEFEIIANVFFTKLDNSELNEQDDLQFLGFVQLFDSAGKSCFRISCIG